MIINLFQSSDSLYPEVYDSKLSQSVVAAKWSLPYWNSIKWIAIILLILLLVPPTAYTAEKPTRQGTYKGYLHPKDRYHYDLHNLMPGDRVRINLRNLSGNLDPFLRVSYGDFTVEDDDSGQGSDSFKEFVAPHDGTYDIEISPYKDLTFGEYELTVEITPKAPHIKDMMTRPVATLDIKRSHVSLAVQELSGSLENPGDIYEHELVHLNSGHTLYIYAESLTEGLDLEVQIKDFQRKVLSDTLHSPATHITKVKFPIVETGDHYDLVVSSEDGKATGNYRILLGIDAPEVLEDIGHNIGDPIIREPTTIHVGFELQQITDVNQRGENFGVVGVFRAEWIDHTQAFDASDYETKKLTYSDRQFVALLEQNNIDWPDFRIVNQQTKEVLHRVLDIYSDGRIFFEEHFAATLQAPEFDFRKFPFDQQDFWLRIETMKPDEFAALALHENPDFNSIGTQLGEEEWVVYEAIPKITDIEGRYHFDLDMKAKRHTTYYIYRLLLPVSLILLIGWGIFFIFDHNTQIAAASGNLLVFIAFNFTVGDDLPRLGYLTFLDLILVIGFVISAVSLMLAFYLKRLEDKGMEDRSVIERRILICLPLTFVLLITISIIYFFIIN